MANTPISVLEFIGAEEAPGCWHVLYNLRGWRLHRFFHFERIHQAVDLKLYFIVCFSNFIK